LTRFKLLAIATACLLATALVAGCDFGGGGDEDPEEVLRETFSGDKQVDSGTIDVSLSGSAEGATGGSGEASVSGPFQSEEGQFPQFDLTASVSAEGLGQSVNFDGGLVSSGEALFVNYQGTDYEVPADAFKQIQKNYEASSAQTTETEGSFQEQCEAAAEQGGVDPSICDFDPLSLFTNLENEGDEDVEGAETVHISGDLNLEEIGNLVSEAIAASPQGQFLPPGSLDQMTAQLEEAVDEASFDVYSGTEDRILRQLDLNFSFVPPDDAAVAVPVESVDLAFSVVLGAVNEPQTIEAPTEAQPLDDLLSELGVSGLPLDDLGGLGGGGGGGAGGGLYDFDGPGGVSPGGGGGGGGGSDDAYLDCVAEAQTPEEIAECVESTQ
jgi:hypothetical protein